MEKLCIGKSYIAVCSLGLHRRCELRARQNRRRYEPRSLPPRSPSSGRSLVFLLTSALLPILLLVRVLFVAALLLTLSGLLPILLFVLFILHVCLRALWSFVS
jgi:hypothetical protein